MSLSTLFRSVGSFLFSLFNLQSPLFCAKNFVAGSGNKVTDRKITYNTPKPPRKGLTDTGVERIVTLVACIIKIPLPQQVEKVGVYITKADTTCQVIVEGVEHDSTAQVIPRMSKWLIVEGNVGDEDFVKSAKLPDDSMMDKYDFAVEDGFLIVVVPRSSN